jgi:hypothetical protein
MKREEMSGEYIEAAMMVMNEILAMTDFRVSGLV